VRTINAAVSQYYDVEEKEPPFEAVIDSATGVERHTSSSELWNSSPAATASATLFIVTPGRTILEKTKDNFTPGHPKSLLAPMSFQAGRDYIRQLCHRPQCAGRWTMTRR